MFFRLLLPGKYRLFILKEGYEPVILKNISVNEGRWTRLDIKMKKKSGAAKK